MQKSLVLILSIVSLFSLTTAEATIEYGGSYEPSDGLGGARVNPEARGCGSTTTYSTSFSKGETQGQQNIDIPEQLQCPPGENIISYYINGEKRSEEVLKVKGKNMDSHVGKYMYVVLNIDQDGCIRPWLDPWDDQCFKPETLNSFFLSNHKHPGWGNAAFEGKNGLGADLLVKEPDIALDDNEGYNVGIGNITSPTSGLTIWLEGVSIIGPPEYEPETPFGILNHDFVSSNKFNSKFVNNAQSATPIHEEGNFRPDGEIMFANYPEYYARDSDQNIVPGPSSSKTERFFICREGATMYNGYANYVPQVVEAKGQLYQCDTSNSVWQQINECEDGLDNDRDGFIDAQSINLASNSFDTSCNSPSDPESGDGECTPAVGYNGNNYVAYYGGGSDGGPQNYCSGDAGNLQTFNDWINNIPGSNGQVPSPTIYQCDEGGATGYCEGRDYYKHDEDSSLPDAQISYVEYYPTTEYFQNGITGNGLSNGEKTSSYFVNKEGWTSAKMSLDGSDVSGNGLKPSERKGAERIYGAVDASTGRHDDSFWFNEKGMVDGDGNGYGTDSFRDSWIAANAGAPNNDQISSEFFGGWAGKCSSGESWRKDQGEWQCSGAVQDWDQVMLAPNIDPGSGEETVGIVVMPYNFMEDTSPFREDLIEIEDNQDNGISDGDLSNVRSYREAVADELPNINFPSQAPTLDTINVKCYPGSDTTAGFDKSKTISIGSTDPTPVVVTGKLELSGSDSYTCNWNYTSSDSSINPVWNDGTPINLAVASDKNNALLDFFQNERGFNDLKRKEYTSSEFEDLVRDWN